MRRFVSTVKAHPLMVLAMALLVAGFWLKGRIFESFADVGGYGLYALYYFEERELAFYLWFATLLLPASLLLALILEKAFSGRTLSRLLEGTEVSDRRFGLFVAAVVSCMAFLHAYNTLGFTPVTDDERTYRFMSDLLLQGRFAYPPQPREIWPFLNLAFTNLDGQWTGIYLWGHPTWLAPGALVGCPHLMTTLASGVTAWCVFRITLRLFDSTHARVAGLLLMISPLFTFGSATLLAHPTDTMLLAVAGLCYLRLLSDGKARTLAGLVMGIALAWAYYSRPATIALVGVIGLALLVQLIRSRGRLLRHAWTVPLGMLLPLLAFGAINLKLGATFCYPDLPSYGNPQFPGVGVGHFVVDWFRFTPLLAASNVLDNLLKLNLWAFGWPVSLVAIAALVFRRPDRNEAVLWAAAIAHVVFVGLYWSSGVDDVGPVYYFELVPILAILTARAIVWGYRRLAELQHIRTARLVVALPVAMALLGTTTAWVLEIATLDAVTSRVRAPEDLVREANIRDGIVFVEPPQRPPNSWVHALPIATPPFNQPLMFFLDHGPKRDVAFAARFPGKTAYRVTWREHGRWTLERLADRRILKRGPTLWGSRAAYPPRAPYPYPALFAQPGTPRPSPDRPTRQCRRDPSGDKPPRVTHDHDNGGAPGRR